jgi:hypothetical protein
MRFCVDKKLVSLQHLERVEDALFHDIEAVTAQKLVADFDWDLRKLIEISAALVGAS